MKTLEAKYLTFQFLMWVMALVALPLSGKIYVLGGSSWSVILLFIMGALSIYGYGWISARLLFFSPIKNLVVEAGRINAEEAGKNGRRT